MELVDRFTAKLNPTFALDVTVKILSSSQSDAKQFCRNVLDHWTLGKRSFELPKSLDTTWSTLRRFRSWLHQDLRTRWRTSWKLILDLGTLRSTMLEELSAWCAKNGESLPSVTLFWTIPAMSRCGCWIIQKPLTLATLVHIWGQLSCSISCFRKSAQTSTKECSSCLEFQQSSRTKITSNHCVINFSRNTCQRSTFTNFIKSTLRNISQCSLIRWEKYIFHRSTQVLTLRQLISDKNSHTAFTSNCSRFNWIEIR